MKQEIPIQNLYYLLTYAWDHFQPGEMQDIASEDCPDLANLFAKVLACGLKHLTRRGLDREYVPHTEELSRLRGRFQLLASERRMSRLRGRMICDFDDLSHDVLHNQILRTTAHRLLSCTDLTPANRHALRLASDPLHHVSLIRITSATFGRVQLHRNNRAYRFLLNLCELIQRNLLPNEESGTHRFQDILRDEVVMHSLFEKFVRNFAARHCAGASVSAKQIAWHVTAADNALAQLPGMVTDVTIEWPERKLILDCKYYREALVARWKDKKLHSANLYQLLAYLQRHQVGGAQLRRQLRHINARHGMRAHIQQPRLRQVRLGLRPHLGQRLLRLLEDAEQPFDRTEFVGQALHRRDQVGGAHRVLHLPEAVELLAEVGGQLLDRILRHHAELDAGQPRHRCGEAQGVLHREWNGEDDVHHAGSPRLAGGSARCHGASRCCSHQAPAVSCSALLAVIATKLRPASTSDENICW